MKIKFIQKIKDWWTLKTLEKEINKEIDSNVGMWFNKPLEAIAEHEDDVQQKYFNGITLMKRRLKEAAGSDVISYMSQYAGRDMLALAADEDTQRKSLRELKESVYIYQGADVKTEEDKLKMVDTRISHYTDLQKAKTSRELLRQARAAFNAGDSETHRQLMKEWDKQYGKSRNNQTKH